MDLGLSRPRLSPLGGRRRGRGVWLRWEVQAEAIVAIARLEERKEEKKTIKVAGVDMVV